MTAWSQAEDITVRDMYASRTRAEIATALGRTEGQVRSRCWTLGLNSKHAPEWTQEEVDGLIDLYNQSGDGPVCLSSFAFFIGKHRSNVCRKARSLGLSNIKRRKVEVRKPPRSRTTSNDEELSQLASARSKKWIADNGHPRGALGMRHSAESKRVLSEKCKARWRVITEEQLAARLIKTAITRHKKGLINARPHTTWKAAWHVIGGARKYYRSRWESNYAYYLEWLRMNGIVVSWQHEPEVFWFTGIKRGCMTYLPDFKVEFQGGRVEYHEVKGWMDAKSKTKIERMAKYHPSISLVVVDGKAYGKLAKRVGALVAGWGSSGEPHAVRSARSKAP